MRIKKDDEWKTVFKTYYGHFKYQVMPFRLTNALAIFQDSINKILAKKLKVCVNMYFDNIFIYTKSKREEYIKAI